jgi:hypothetical protein
MLAQTVRSFRNMSEKAFCLCSKRSKPRSIIWPLIKVMAIIESQLRFVALEVETTNGQPMQWFQQTGGRLTKTETVMQEAQDNVQTPC